MSHARARPQEGPSRAGRPICALRTDIVDHDATLSLCSTNALYPTRATSVSGSRRYLRPYGGRFLSANHSKTVFVDQSVDTSRSGFARELSGSELIANFLYREGNAARQT